MGEDLTLPERYSVRTPMQWSTGRHGGFSTAPEGTPLVRPVIRDGEYGLARVNVADQQRAPDSLLNWMQRVIGIRRGCPELGWGTADTLDVGDPAVLVLRTRGAGHCTWCVHNLAAEDTQVRLELQRRPGDEVTEVLADAEYGPASDGMLRLNGYGYRWLRRSGSVA